MSSDLLVKSSANREPDHAGKTGGNVQRHGYADTRRQPSREVLEMQPEGAALTGKTVGVIQSRDAIREEAPNLSLKLFPKDGSSWVEFSRTQRPPAHYFPMCSA